MNRWQNDMRALGLLLVLLIASAGADASTEIENAISPNKKLILTMKPAGEFDYKVFLKDRANDKLLTSFNVDGLFAHDVRHTMTADWRNDSAAVALNIDKGRNISKCEIIVLTNGQWKRLAWPEKELKAVRERNNEEGGKSQDYLTFAAWLSSGLKVNYQGNLNSQEELDFRIVPGAKAHLKLNQTWLEAVEKEDAREDVSGPAQTTDRKELSADASFRDADRHLNEIYNALRARLFPVRAREVKERTACLDKSAERCGSSRQEKRPGEPD